MKSDTFTLWFCGLLFYIIHFIFVYELVPKRSNVCLNANKTIAEKSTKRCMTMLYRNVHKTCTVKFRHFCCGPSFILFKCFLHSFKISMKQRYHVKILIPTLYAMTVQVSTTFLSDRLN